MKVTTFSFLLWLIFFLLIFDLVLLPKEMSYFHLNFTPKIIEKEDTKLSVSFLWDVMIWWRVWKNIEKNWIWKVIDWTKWYLSKRDAVILNFEWTVTERKEAFNKKYTFKTPAKNLVWLKQFNDKLIVNLANNHSYDFFEAGLKDTMNNLKNAWIEYLGAGFNEKEAYSYKISKIGLYKFAFISQNCIWPVSAEAWENKAWIAFFDKEKMKKEIKKAKYEADFVIFSGHCWTEYSDSIQTKQASHYRAAIDAWADAVIGHHPHWYQAIEEYKWKYIFYSLGDYIFDIHRNSRAEEWIIVTMAIEDKKITDYFIIPVVIDWFWETKFPTKSKRQNILNNLYKISQKFGDIEWIKDWIISNNYN